MSERINDPVFVLVEPQLGENIGAAMRAMCNFGVRRLRLVNPRDKWPNAAGIALATGADQLLESTTVYSSTSAAVSDCVSIYATTARPRGVTKRVLTPEAGMREIRAHCEANRRIAVLFGPERSGLSNADVILSTAIISVPVDSAFPSLNLSQCVLLVAYEWRKAALCDATGEDGPELASVGTVSRFLEHLTEELDDAGCFFTDHKRAAMSATLENLFRRAPLTDHDVRTLWRVVRSLSEKRERS